MSNITSSRLNLYGECILQTKQISLEITGILPDSRPRIHTIEDTSFSHTLSSVSYDNKSVHFSLSLRTNTLYTGVSTWGGEEAMNATSFEMEKSIRDSIEYEGNEKDVRLISLDTTLDNIECIALTPRKMCVKAYITVCAIFSPVIECNIASSDKDNICTASQKLDITQPVASFKTQAFVKEDIRLPQGTPNIRRILRKRIALTSQSVKTEGSRGIIYSTADVFVIYEMEEEPSSVSAFKVSLDYNHAIELPLDEDKASGVQIHITQDIGDAYAEIKEEGVISVEFVVGYDTKIHERVSYTFPWDGFSLSGEDIISCSSIAPTELFTVSNPIGICSEKLYLSSGTPGQILDCEVKPLYINTSYSQGGITAEGVYSVKAIYSLKDDPSCIGVSSSEIPFSYFCECPYKGNNSSVLSAVMDISSVAAEISSFDDIPVKWSVCVNILCQNTIPTSYISSISPNNDMPEAERCIYCYNKSENESLWEIAKKFRASPLDICNINSKTEEEINTSALRLIIVKGT